MISIVIFALDGRITNGILIFNVSSKKNFTRRDNFLSLWPSIQNEEKVFHLFRPGSENWTCPVFKWLNVIQSLNGPYTSVKITPYLQR